MSSDEKYHLGTTSEIRSTPTDIQLELATLQCRYDELLKHMISLDKTLEQCDDRIRQMRADGEITMKEMGVALKPIMWMCAAYSAAGEKFKLEGCYDAETKS